MKFTQYIDFLDDMQCLRGKKFTWFEFILTIYIKTKTHFTSSDCGWDTNKFLTAGIGDRCILMKTAFNLVKCPHY